MAFNITAIMNVALASGAATKISRDINRALQNKRVNVDLSLANPDSIKRIKADIEGAITSVESFGRQAGLAAKRFGAFSLAAGSMITLVSAIKSSTSEAIAFDREMVRLGQVSNDSVASIQAVGNEVTRLSVSLGVSSKDLIGAAVTLKQANLSINDTKIALEALAKAALAPNFENFANTTQGAIAVLNQFKIGAAGLESALGSINAVAGEYAVEASDLVEAIRKTGGAFKSAGGDLNELLALFTSVRQTTRESAETISTGLRTIFTRIQRGKTIDSLKDLGIQLRYTSQEAAALGNVKLEDQFVGPYEAVRRLSEALAGIPTTSGKYSAIVEELGGYRQISKVIPLLQEFSVSQGALNVALGGSSSLAANAAQAQNAYIIKIQKIKEEFNALIRSVTQSSGFQKIFDTFISGASAAIQLADALKFLLPLITAIAAVKLATSFGQFVKGFATGVTASPNPKIFNQNRVAEGGYIKMKNGGVVPGSGSGDKVKTLLEPGELVIPKKYVGGGPVSVSDMPSLAIQRRLNDPTIPDSNYIEGKTLNKSDKFKYEIVNIKIDGGPDSIKPGDYKYEGEYFENIAALKLNAQRLSKDNATAPVDLEKNGFPYEVKNVSTPVRDTDIVDKLARYRLEKFGDNIFKNSSKGEETVDLGQIGLVYNTAKMDINKTAFKDTETITDGQENYRRKTYATQTSEGISNVTLSTQEAKNRLATKKATGGFMIPGTGNTDSVPMDLDEGSFVVRKSSVAKLGAENLSSISRKGYAKGGKVPALLMPGEFVFSPSSAKSIGSANLERMNKHAKFAAGGRVGFAAGGNSTIPIGNASYGIPDQEKIKIPNFQSLEQFVKGFPDLDEARKALQAVMLEEASVFRADLSEVQKHTKATALATEVIDKYKDLKDAITAQEAVLSSAGSAGSGTSVPVEQNKLNALKAKLANYSDKIGISNVVLPTGDVQTRTEIGSNSPMRVGRGSDYNYKTGQDISIANEVTRRASTRAKTINPDNNGENVGIVTKQRLAAEEELKLRNQAVLAIGEQLRITTGITDKQVLLEMATEKFAVAMAQNAKLAKDSEGRLLGLASLEADILASGATVDQSMRGVSEELKTGKSAFGKLKLTFRNIDDALIKAGNEFVNEMKKGGGGITGTFSALKNSKLGQIGSGVAGAGLAIGGSILANTGGTAEDVGKGLVSRERYVASTGIGEGISQAATTAVSLSLIPVVGPFLAVIGGLTAGLFGLIGAVRKAQIELMKMEVDKNAKIASEQVAELRNFSGAEREQKSISAFTNVRSSVFAIRQTAQAEGLSGAQLENEVKSKSLEKFGPNLGAISEEISNAVGNMVKPDDKRKSVDIYNEFKGTQQGRLAIEALGYASGKTSVEVQKQALAVASSAITAKKLEDAQKNSVIIHEKITLRITTLTNSVNLASESFKNISESMGNFSDKLEGRSEFKIQQSPNKLKIGTDKGLFDKEADKVFASFGELGKPLKDQSKELNTFALELPLAFDSAKERAGVSGDVGKSTEEILKTRLGVKDFSSGQKEYFELFKAELEKKQSEPNQLKGVTGDKISKDALSQTISQTEQLLQSNAQSLNQVTQSYISGLRRISEEQKKYIQELDKVSDKSLAVNKADAAIKARAVRGNPEDFLTKEQRIAPFVEKQTNVTAEAVKRGDIKIGEIQDPQAIFDNIKKAAKALEESDKELQASNADLASSNDAAREKARGIAEKNNNLRDTVSSLGEALRNLRDDTVTLAEAESRLTKAEKDRESKLTVAENLLTMDRAGKRNLQRGKDAAEQVAGGANLEDMSLKQRKAFFEYTKLYANIKVPELGGKTGDQVRQVALEKAAGGLGLGVGKENTEIDKAMADMKTISENQKKAAEKYAELIKVENSSQIKELRNVNNEFIRELGNLLARENNRGIGGQIKVDQEKKDRLKGIEGSVALQLFKGLNLAPQQEKQFLGIFGGKSGEDIKQKIDQKKSQQEMLSEAQARIAKGEGNGIYDDEIVKTAKEEIKRINSELNIPGFGFPRVESIASNPQLLRIVDVAQQLKDSNLTMGTLPTEIEKLAKSIADLSTKIIKEKPAVLNNANGGFIGRSMGGSIYNNPTKDIAQRDQYPTYLSEGEFVVNKEGARNNRSELELMNKGHKVNYFAEGTPETAEQMRTRLFKNKYGFDPSLTKEEREKVSKDGAPKRTKSDKELKDLYEKNNLTKIAIPENFEFEGQSRDRKSIYAALGKSKDLEYGIRDIRSEFEKSVSDLAYVNKERKKLEEDKNIASDILNKIAYSTHSNKDVTKKALSIDQIKASEKNFNYKDNFFGELSAYTPRYSVAYGDRIDESVSNNIRSNDGHGLRDVWNKIAASYGNLKNPLDITPNTRIQPTEHTSSDIDIEDLNKRFAEYNNSEYLQKFPIDHKGSYSLDDVRNNEKNKKNRKIGSLEGRSTGTARNQIWSVAPFRTKNPNYKKPTDTFNFKLDELSNQEEANILFDLIKKTRAEKERVLSSSLERIKDLVENQIKSESNMSSMIELKGEDATSAKIEANLQARLKNSRLSSDKLPFPTRPSRRLDKDGTTSPSEEFTQEAKEKPIHRLTMAMQEAKMKEDENFMSADAKNARLAAIEKKTEDLKYNMLLQGKRHTNPKELEGIEDADLTTDNVKALGGPENDPQKILAFKKKQIRNGDTDSIAQRLHTQIAKTIAYQKNPNSDIDDPEVYSPFLRTVNISKLGEVKTLSSASLKEYESKQIPVLNPAIMALQEYYDSVHARRYNFEEPAIVYKKDLDLAAKMDREAVMLIARKARGEIKVNEPLGEIDFKSIAIQDFLERRKKEEEAAKNTSTIKNQSGQVINVPKNRAEAAKVIAEEQAKPVGQAKPPVIPMPVQESKPVVAADQTKPKISPEEMMNKLFNEGPKEGKAVLDFNQNGIRIQGSPEQEKEYATVQTYLNSPTYKAMKILQDKIDNIKLKQSLDTVQDSTAYPENAELSDTIYLRWLNEQVSTLKSQDIISEPYKAYIKLVTGKIGEKFIDFKSSGGPVAYRSFGGGVGGVDAMLTPGEMVISPEKAAENEGVLRHINNGGDVKNFNFGGRVRRGRSFRVPAYAPNPDPERFEKVGSDSVAAPGLAAGSFVVNARDTAKNLPFLQHLASGGSVGYYQKGGGLDKKDFNLLGYPTDENLDFSKARTALMERVYGNAELKATLKEYAGGKSQGLEDLLQEIVSEHFHKNKIGRIGAVRNRQTALYDAIMPGYNNIDPANFKSFLSGNALENTEKQYRDLVNKKSDKDLQNLPALNAELNSPFKPSKPISEQESLDKETGRLNRESNRTEIEKLKIKLSQLKQDPFNPKVNAEYDRVSALIEKKEKKSRDMIGYPLKEEEDDGGAAAEEERLRNEKIRMTTANRIPIAIRKMQLDRLDIFDPDKIMEIQQLQEEISILEGNPKDLARTAYIDELARRKRLSPEQKNQEALDKETRRQNRESNRTEVENLRTKRDQIKLGSIDPKDKNNIEHKRISDLIEEKEAAYIKMIAPTPPRLKKEDFGLLPQAPGFANGGTVGYYEDGGITNPAIGNFSNIGKKPQEKNNGFDVNSFVQKAVEEQKAKEEEELKKRIKDKKEEMIDNKQRIMALNKNRANQKLNKKDSVFLKENEEADSDALGWFDKMMLAGGIGKSLVSGGISLLGNHAIPQVGKHVAKESLTEAGSYLGMMGFEQSTHAIVDTFAKNKKDTPSYASNYANGGAVGYFEDGGFSNFKRFEGYGSSSGLSTLTTPIVNEALKNQYKPQMSGMVNNDQSFTNNSSDINTKNGLEMALDFGADESSSKDLKKIIEDLLTKQDFSKKMRTSSLKGYANGGAVGYYAAGDVVTESDAGAAQAEKRRMEEAIKRQEEIRKINRRKNNEGSEGVIGGIRPNEMKILKGKEKPPDGKPDNRLVNELSMEELHNVINELAGEKLDVLGADKLQRARQEFANRVKKIQFNERYTQLNNALNSQKRGGKKDHTKQGEQFESFLTNNGIKGQVHTDRPFRLRDNPDIDKSYLTGIAHFEPNILSKLNDKKIETIAMNLIKKQKIKGFSGETANFNEANYFGEIGDAFNSKHTFLKMSDVIKITDLLDRQDKGRETNLNSAALGQRIKSKNPLDGLDFMLEYGQQDPERKPDDAFRTHSALTAQVSNINPDLKPDGRVNFKRNGVALLEEDLLKGRVGQEIDLTRLKKPVKKAFGGYINGASDGDTVPALLSAGEFVMPRHAVNRIGLDNLEKMRKPQRFFDGGAVGSPRASVFDKMNNVANSQSANSMDVDSLNNAAREFNKAAKSFETSMAKMEKSAKTLEGAMDKLSKVNIPENITGTIKVDNKIDLDITSSNFAMDMTTAVGKAVSDITGRLKDATDGKIDIA